MEIGWEELYRRARAVQHGRSISPFVEAGGVAAALLTESGNIYTGVCIDTACSLGMCAERNAIANMITNGEHTIRRAGCRDAGRAAGDALRRLPGADDAAGRQQWGDRNSDRPVLRRFRAAAGALPRLVDGEAL